MAKKTKKPRREQKKKRSLKAMMERSRAKKIINMQHEDGTPMDMGDGTNQWRMNKKQAADYDEVVKGLMEEKGFTENEAINEVLRRGMDKLDASTQTVDGKLRRLNQGLAQMENNVQTGMAAMEHNNRKWVSQVVTGAPGTGSSPVAGFRPSRSGAGVRALTGSPITGLIDFGDAEVEEYAADDCRYLLEPEHNAELEAMIAMTMKRDNRSYSDARAHVLTEGDKTMTLEGYERVISYYEENPLKMGKDANLQIVRDLYRKLKNGTIARDASEPWFKRLKKMGDLNLSAHSLLRWIGILTGIEKWAIAEEDPLDEGSERVRAFQLEMALNCKVFDVDPQEAQSFLQKISTQMDQILEIDAGDLRDWTPEEEEIIYLQTQAMGFPENLPYPNTFIGFGYGIEANTEAPTSQELQKLADHANSSTVRNTTILGILYGPGSIEVLFGWEKKEGHAHSCIPNLSTLTLYSDLTFYSEPEGWIQNSRRSGKAAFQWLAVALIDTIHSHRTVVLKTPVLSAKSERHLGKLKRSLDLKIFPAAFYMAQLRSKVYMHAIRRLAPVVSFRRAMAYRTDRRAHERCQVRRGLKPKTEEERLDFKHLKIGLLKRGYRIYENNELSEIDLARLSIRCMPRKHHTEWLAILSYDVRHTIVGPPEAPYTPRVDIIEAIDPEDIAEAL